MLTEQEALSQILASIVPLSETRVALIDALDCFATRNVLASLPLPNFDNSAMDGYAVRAKDTLGEASLKVIAEQPAGVSRHLKLEPETAIRIFTGAPMPEGADAVIMQEDVTILEDGKRIRCNDPVLPGENVRIMGCDLCAGQIILASGERLTPMNLGVLASQGFQNIEVSTVPRLAVVTTGDELVSAGGTTMQPALLAGQLYNSNSVMLLALVKRTLRAQLTTKHICDSASETERELKDLIANNDFIILSGGVSVGDHDCVKPALEALGIKPRFWRVKVKPGKPLLFVQAGRPDGGSCYIFGLPGNPVSSFVTFQVFVRPALLKVIGAGDDALPLPQSMAVLAAPVANRGDRPHYVRGRLCDGKFSPTGLQQSHALFALSQANALLRMEPEESCEAGAMKTVLMV